MQQKSIDDVSTQELKALSVDDQKEYEQGTKCPECKGTGIVTIGNNITTCPLCKGTKK